jgi:hypothetical protein
MSRPRASALIVTILAGALAATAGEAPVDLPGLLARVGERVQAFYDRAQSIVCAETISFEFLDTSLSRDPRNRRLQYDLRMSWEKIADSPDVEGTALRTLKTVNGRPPKPNDDAKCLDPKPTAVDTLSFLLPHHQKEYTFIYKGVGKTGDGHTAVMVDYVPLSKEKPKYVWNESCFSVDAPTRTRGRVWIDRFGGDVLRLDETLSGPLDVDVPKAEQRRSGVNSLTIDRSDTTVRYKTVTFTDPNEIVLLPDEYESMVVVRGQPRQRTSHKYTGYQRFVTGGRLVVGDP